MSYGGVLRQCAAPSPEQAPSFSSGYGRTAFALAGQPSEPMMLHKEKTMEWVCNPSHDPAFNLAVEETLLETVSADRPFVGMLWVNRPTVVIGRFQNARREVNADVARERDIAVVRRMTGGGAVYHDLGTLNYTFIHYLDHEGHIPSFREAGRPVAEALQSLNLPVTFSGRNDLLLEDRKVAGVAYCRQGRRYLHHGCILVDTDLARLTGVLSVDPAKLAAKGVASVRSRVTNLADWLAERQPSSPRLTVQDVCTAILARGGVSRPLTEAETRSAESLRAQKYAAWDWVYGAAPPYTERKTRRFAWGGVEALFDVRQGRVAGCRLYGDFLGDSAGPALIEQALTGIRYEAGCLRTVLDSLPLERLFSGGAAEELKAFLLPE